MRLMESLFAGFLLLISSKAFLPLLNGNPEPDAVQVNSMANRALWIFFYLVVLLVLALTPRRTFRAIVRSPIVVAFSMLVVASYVWSGYPESTRVDAVSFLLSTIIGIFLATRLQATQFIRALSWALTIAVVASMLWALAIPAYGTDQLGNWIGVFNHKNRLGAVMSLAALVWANRLFYEKRNRITSVTMLALSLGMLVMSNSKTALAILLITIMVILLAPTVRRMNWGTVGMSWIVIWTLGPLAVALTLANLDYITGWLGRDSTLTGRTGIWQAVVASIGESPLLGYGYAGYWHGPEGPARAAIMANGGYPLTHAHNGFLDVALATGLVGVILMVVVFAGALWNAIQAILRDPTSHSVFQWSFVLFLLTYNLFESNLIEHNSIWWILLVYCTIAPLSPSDRPGRRLLVARNR